MKNSVSVPSEAVNVYNNALNLSNSGKLAPAIDEYKKAINIYPGFIEAYNNIGEIYSKMGDRSKAISTYMEALAIQKNSRVLLNLGVEYYNDGEYKNAFKYFKDATTLDSEFLEGHFYTAMTHFNQKEYKQAENCFQNVVKLDKKHLKANYLLSYIYYDWKKYKKALECLDRIKDIADDKVFVNKYYGFCCYHTGRFDEAVEYLQSALKNCPEYSKFKNYLKKMTYENKVKEIGDIKSKIKEMEEKVMKKENMPSIGDYTNLSMLYIFDGQYKKAEDLLLSVNVH